MANFIGSNQNDVLTGEDSNDYLSGGYGNDTLDGGVGNDYIMGGYGNDDIDGGAGNDRVIAGYGNDTGRLNVTENVGSSNFYDGGYGADTLIFTMTQSEYLDAVADFSALDAHLASGSTASFSFSAFDLTMTNWESYSINISGTAPGEIITGSDAVDVVIGSNGDDVITTLGGNDVIHSGNGNDTIQGGAGEDVIYGEQDNDNIDGGADRDVIYGGQGNDTIQGEDGDDHLNGGNGIDTITGGAGNDYIDAEYGNDIVDGGAGDDNVYARYDNDTGIFNVEENWSSTNMYDGGYGTDVLELHMTYGEKLVLGADLDALDTYMAGSSQSDFFQFGTFDFRIKNWESYSVVYINNDPVALDDAASVVGNAAVDGNVLVNDSDTDRFDSITVTAFDAVSNLGAVVSFGVNGDYAYDPSAIYASLSSGNVVDTFTYTVTDLGGATATATVSITITVSAGAAPVSSVVSTSNTIIGTDVNESLAGTADADAISGLAGNDVIYGRYGDDVIHGQGGNDVIYGEYGNDTLNGGQNDDYIVAGYGNDIIDGGAGNDRVIAGYGNDTGIFYVNENTSFTNTYDGGAGTDSLALYMTAAEVTAATDDLAALNIYMAGSSQSSNFSFNSFNLTIKNWESYDLYVINEVTGDSSANTLDATSSVDLLFGDVGSDTFIFSAGDSDDTITDFVSGAGSDDVIDLSGHTGADNFASVLALTEDNGSDAVIDFGNGDTITLLGVQEASLHQDDFVF